MRPDELEELRRAEDRVRDAPALIASSWATFARMYPLSASRSAPTTDSATWWPTPAAVSAARSLLDRGLEELQHRVVLPGRGVRDVDDDLSAFERFGEALAGEGVDARVRRRRERVVAVLSQLLDELRPDEASPADDDDPHFNLLSQM